ncbi:MAG: hypothetical protein CME26_10675 [Gemmatimonadetes bacterium]|nr:hypothetical protein [Gemmatimonadota bacterium]|tara:strand:- start:7601 stop:8557 length:957 start_codon:yes stop_codon:yes gene_type:complete
MYVGVQGIGTSKHELQFLTRHGVTHMDGAVSWSTAEELAEHREKAAEEGVELEMVHVSPSSAITLAQDPQRDKEIDAFCERIEGVAKAGLRGINYGFCILPHQRTERRYGRGGSGYSSFEIDKFDNETLSEAGEVSREEAFDRVAYFLERMMPVAESNNVQMACHLNDPPAPHLKHVERWNWPVFEGLKRFSEIVDSPYHGFNFCCGVASEGLDNPAKELPPIVKYFAERKKIFNVHFRNIRGGLHDFVEVWPDEGDVDMHYLAKIFQEAGYEYMLMPDHAPHHPDDEAPEGVSSRVRQGWAFQFGYIKALIQAVEKK